MTTFISNIKKYKSYILYAPKAILRSEVSESYLNWIWWLLEPFLFMLIYTFVAIVVFGRGEQYFMVFTFIGYNTWKLFENSIKRSVKLIRSYKGILSKIYVPKYIMIIVEIMVNVFKTTFSYIVVFFLMIYYKVPISWNVLAIIPIHIVLCTVTFGFCTILTHCGVYFTDLANLTNVGLKLVFYLSGIFYNIESRIKSPMLKILLLKCNPIANMLSQLRNCMLYQTSPDWMMLGIWFTIGIAFSCLGIHLIHKYETSYVKVI